LNPVIANGVNTVYKSSNMELSKYINKTNDIKSNELGGYKAIIENKGSRCQCSKVPNVTEQRQLCGSYCKHLYP